ncbi:MAG: hypothetical protein J6T10_30375 [Methanobrevibacter sp.]|nr:hypothetical protein [Methanobrevibacter sp.]
MAGDNSINIVARFNGTQAFQGITRLERSFGRLKRVFTFVIANKMIKDMANFGKELSLMADRTGISIEKLSSLRNVFISAGSGAKGFQQTIDRINTGLMGLRRGEGALAAQLAPFGISPFGKTADEILLELAEGSKNMISAGRSKESVLDYLMNIMGIDPATASKLIQGRDAWLADQKRLEGKVGTVKFGEDLNKLNQAMNELGVAFSNATANIVGFMTPVLIPFFEALTSFITTIGENEIARTIIGITASLLGFLLTLRSLSGILGILKWLFVGKMAGGVAGGATTGIMSGLASPALVAGCHALGVVIMAIAALAAGGAIGKLISETEWFKKASSWIGDRFSENPYSPDDPRHWAIVIDKMQKSGQLTEEQANAMREQHGLPRKMDLFSDSDNVSIIWADEPLISDENYEKPVIPNSGVNIVNHFEGSTFGSDLPATEEAINESMQNTVLTAIPGFG